MGIEQNKKIVAYLFQRVWLKGDLSAVDELVAADYVLHNRFFPPGRQGFKQAVAMMRETFPAFGGRIEDLLAEGDKVACRWIRYSLHEGEFMNTAATGQEVVIQGINIYRLDNNQVAEEWIEVDMLGLMQQIGAFPPSG